MLLQERVKRIGSIVDQLCSLLPDFYTFVRLKQLLQHEYDGLKRAAAEEERGKVYSHAKGMEVLASALSYFAAREKDEAACFVVDALRVEISKIF